MVDPVLIDLIYASSVAQVAMGFGAVYYAYRIIRLLGSFLAWTLIVIGFLLQGFRNAISLLLLPLIQQEALNNILSSVPASTVYTTQVLALLSSAILLVGVYMLHRTFVRQKSKKP